MPDGIIVGEDGLPRCWWADSTPEYRAYHDTEWGFPVADDRRLFEKLCLEGFQAGLSWLTILRKREATINNAARALELVEREGSLAHFLWGFEVVNAPTMLARAELPVLTTESKALAKEFKRRGWRFLGPTTVYAFMEAMGLVNDHLSGCHCRAKVDAARVSFKRP